MSALDGLQDLAKKYSKTATQIIHWWGLQRNMLIQFEDVEDAQWDSGQYSFWNVRRRRAKVNI
jgi:hypothetical protein